MLIALRSEAGPGLSAPAALPAKAAQRRRSPGCWTQWATGCPAEADLALRESLRRGPNGREPPGTGLDTENSQGYFQAPVAPGKRLAQNQVSSSTKKNYTSFPNQ